LRLEIGDSEVRVWAFPLDVATPVVEQLARALSEDERARADRFVFDRDRRRFQAARGWLRAVLGQCLDIDAGEVRFDYSAAGKPSLAAAENLRLLHFNLSHSEDLAVVAVTPLAPLGIDVERLRPLDDADALVARFFSSNEIRAFTVLPADQRVAAFFALWTRKEALLKATGEGLGQPLSLVEVSFLPAEPARVVAIADRADRAARWRLEHLTPRTGFVGAVAIERTDARVLPCEWGWP
jgi:4'-phosphopantetheinyl transferase